MTCLHFRILTTDIVRLVIPMVLIVIEFTKNIYFSQLKVF